MVPDVKKCGRMDGMDDAKTISLRIRRGIIIDSTPQLPEKK